jgi:thioredoxin-like negative regulator of GroEL
MKPLTNSQYQSEVQNYPGSVILLFTALWCQPAIKTANFLRSTNLNTKIFSVDYDSERELDNQFSVRELPTVIGIFNGNTTFIGQTCENQTQLDTIRGTFK